MMLHWYPPPWHNLLIITDISQAPAVFEAVSSFTLKSPADLCLALTLSGRRWPYPRGDLYHWIPLLDRFDSLLADIISTYALHNGPQLVPFKRDYLQNKGHSIADLDALSLPEDADRLLAERIVAFTRLLIENCGNRSLYSSSEHLSNLLNTTNLSLLNQTLHLSLRLAQRYSASRLRTGGPHLQTINHTLLASHYALSLEKMEKLALPFVKNLDPLKQDASKSKDTDKGVLVTPSYLSDLALPLSTNEALPTRWEKHDFDAPWLNYYHELDNQNTQPDSPTPISNASSSLLPPQSFTPAPSSALSLGLRTDSDNPTSGIEDLHTKSGFRLAQLPRESLQDASVCELAAKYLPSVPLPAQYEFFTRIRTAEALTGTLEDRSAITATRMLAIANLAHIYPEHMLQSKVLQHEIDGARRAQLPYQLCNLIRSPTDKDSAIPRSIQSFALLTLEALTAHKIKATEIFAALGANVNHGVLTFLLRDSVTDLAIPKDEETDLDQWQWRENLFTLLHALPKANTRAGDGFVSAGLLEILVSALTYRTLQAEYNHPRVLHFLEVFLYNTRDAFSSMVNADGLDIISALAEYEVASALSTAQHGKGLSAKYRSQVADYEITFSQQQTLRALFKVIKNMMRMNTGAFDRLLRNLIESSQLLDALKIVISQPTVFGSSVWSSAVGILSEFIHNEPTSYAAIAEAGLPRAFLETVTQRSLSGPKVDVEDGAEAQKHPTVASNHEKAFVDSSGPLSNGVLPSLEAIRALPSAFGAICLNEAGMELFEASNALSRFFEIFTSPRHLKVLASSVNGELEHLGSAFDELGRHHPRLKTQIVKGVAEMARQFVRALYGRAYVEQSGAKLWYEDEVSRKPVPAPLPRQNESPRYWYECLPEMLQPSNPAGIGSTESFQDVTMQDTGEPSDQGEATKAQDASTASILPQSFAKLPGVSEILLLTGPAAAVDGSPPFPHLSHVNTIPDADELNWVLASFMAGFFANPTLCQAFADEGGVEALVDVVTSPSLRHELDELIAYNGLWGVVKIFVENVPHLILPLLVDRAEILLQHLSFFVNQKPHSSVFVPCVQTDQDQHKRPSEISHAAYTLRLLVLVGAFCQILAACLEHPTHRNHPVPFNQLNLVDYMCRIIESLGKLQVQCLQENMLLLENVSISMIDPSTKESNRQQSAFEMTTDKISEAVSSAGSSLRDSMRIISPDQSTGSCQRVNFVTLREVLLELPKRISTLFSALGRSLTSKRSDREGGQFQQQCSVEMSDHLGTSLMSMLNFHTALKENTKHADYYSRFALALVQTALMDQRSETMDRLRVAQPMTMVIQSFRSVGGFKSVAACVQTAFDNHLALRHEEQHDAQKSNIDQGIQLALKLLQDLTSQTLIADAHQTTAMTHRDREKEKPFAFNAAQLIVELRVDASNAILPIFNHDALELAPPAIIPYLCKVLQQVLDGGNENGALRRGETFATASKSIRKPWKPRTTIVDRIVEKGYDRNLAEEALYRCADSHSSAVEYCAARKRNPALPRLPIRTIDKPAQPMVDNTTSLAVPNDATGSAGHVSPLALGANESTALVTDLMRDLVDNSSAANLPHESTLTPRDTTSVELTDLNTSEDNKSSDRSTSASANINDLDEIRIDIRAQLVERCLLILRNFPNMSFVIADLLIAGVNKAIDPASLRTEIGQTIVQTLVSYEGGDDFEENSTNIGGCAHLLGLLLQDRDFFRAAQDELKDSFSTLLTYVNIPARMAQKSTSPWIGHVLLIFERLLSEDAIPQQIKWLVPESGSVQLQEQIVEVVEPYISFEDKQLLLDRILDILPRIGKDRTMGLAVVRILVALSRDRVIATKLGQRPTIQRLFLMVKQLQAMGNVKFHSSFMLILRHIIEDDGTVRQIMRSEIQEFFQKPRQATDITNYTRTLYYLVLRAPTLFVEITNEMVMLAKFDTEHPGGSTSIMALKRSAIAKTPGTSEQDRSKTLESKSPEQHAGQDASSLPEVSDRNKAPEMKAPVVENPDGVVHFLLSELLAYKDVTDNERAPARPISKYHPEQQDVEMIQAGFEESENTEAHRSSSSAQHDSDHGKLEFKSEDYPIYMYRCFILQCLMELLQSYMRTKIEFINFSRKSDPQVTTPSKPRSGILNYLLNVLIPTGSLAHAEDNASRTKLNISNLAVCAVVALCTRTGERHQRRLRDNELEDEPDLLFVRRFVLEHALKAYKDAIATCETLDAKYSKLMCVADLFSRLLAGRPSATTQSRYERANEFRSDDLVPSQKELAKIMFEKGFIIALTASISEVDLNFPGASRAVKYILRPLKLLTHTAIDLSLSSDASTSPGQKDDDEISSATSVSEAEGDREETPDLFRNSTLGMFEPGRDEDSQSDSSEEVDEEDVYGEEYADDMEYEEDDDDAVSEEEDEAMEGVIGPIEGLPGQMDMEIEIGLEEDDDADDDSPSEDSDDDDDDSEESMDDIDNEDDDNELVVGEITADGQNGSLDEDDEDAGNWHDNGDEPPLGFALTSDPGSPSETDMTFEDGAGPIGIMDESRPIDIEHDHDGAMGDESQDEENEDEDEEDVEYDEGDGFDLGDEESDMVGLDFSWPPPQHRHGPASHQHRHHFAPVGQWQHESIIMPTMRSHRPPGVRRAPDDGTNPLLHRSVDATVGATPSFAIRSGNRHRALTDVFPPGGDLRAMMRGLVDMDATASNLLNVFGHGFAPIPYGFQQRNGGVTFSMTNALRDHMVQPADMGQPRYMNGDLGRSDAFSATASEPASTEQRWQEVARLLFGSSYTEKSQRVVNSILALLVPPAIEAEQARKKQEEDDTRQRLESEANKKAEQEAREKQLQEVREEAEKKQRETVEGTQGLQDEGHSEVEHDVNEHTTDSGDANETMAADTTEHAGDDAMEGVEVSNPPAAALENGPSAGAAAPITRVFTEIRGRQLDITDLGIDLTYIEALPDEMREEVIMQQYAEQRSHAAASGQEPTAINSEFLDALPSDIREELLQQEAQDRRHREREETRRQARETGAASGPEDMDPASFFASLDPHLRQQVLAESDEDMLAQLPAEIAAEARALGGHHRRRALDPTRISGLGTMPLGMLPTPHGFEGTQQRSEDRQSQRRPIVQMIDKAGIATLLRLMFVSVTGNSRSSLNGILRNACGNRQTRGEVVNGLLSILQDGTADIGAVERCFAQLTLRAKQLGSTKATQVTKKSDAGPSVSSETSPVTVVGQCLSALVFLTQSIPHVSHFFLTEHELSGGFKTKTSRKAKAKESRASKYPINALLSLLDRESVINNSFVMEQLAGLLASITQPLSILSKKEKEQKQSLDVQVPHEALHSEQDQVADPSTDNTTSADIPGTTSNQTVAVSQPDEMQALSAIVSIPNDQIDDVNATTAQSQKEAKDETKKPRLITPPEITPESLQLVVDILTARDCSSKTFRDTVTSITNLSAIPGAKTIFGEKLIQQAQRLGETIQTSLAQLVQALESAESEMQAQSMALAQFSPTGSDQAKLNRILTVLDYLFEVSSEDAKDTSTEKLLVIPESRDLLLSLYENPSFLSLWHSLSACLSATQQSESKYFFNVATILLPLIEALMVVCKRVPSKIASSVKKSQIASASDTKEATSIRDVFFKFTNRHKKILNDLVRQNPKLMSGSFSVLVKNSSVLEFDNKRNFFNRRLHQRNTDTRHYPHPTLGLNVRRDQVFLDSYKHLHYKTPDEIKYGRFNIRFHNEEGVDAGGVTREWFQVLARQMFNPDYALFNPVASDRTTFHPNNLSSINPEHLQFFKFIGRMIGKALYENRVLDCHFSRAVYKRILGQPVSMKDMETVDLEYTKNMEWMLANDITDIITETFSVAQDRFGDTEIVDLVPFDRNVAVTEDNKQEYVRLVIEHRLTGSVQDQLQHFLEGKGFTV